MSYPSQKNKDAAIPDLTTIPGVHLTDDLYKSLVEHAHDSIYVLQNERFTFVNPRFCELTGYTQEQLTAPGFNPDSLLSGFSRALIKQYVDARVAGDQSPFRYEIELVDIDGEIIPGDLTTVVVPNQPGITILGIFRDLTEKKQYEQESEIRVRKLQDAIEAVADGVWDWNLVTNQVWINPASRQLFGLPLDQEFIQADVILGFLHPEDMPSIREQLQSLIEGRIRFYSSEFRILQDNHVVRWVLGRGKIVDYGEDGTPLRVVGTNVNITERKEAELLLRESEEKFMRVFENAPLLMAITSLVDGRCLEINSVFAKVFGYQRHEVVGHTSIELGLATPEERNQKLEIIEREGSIRNFEVEYTRADGSPLYCLYSADKVEINGEPCLLSIATDITQKRLEERNERATYQLLKLISEETDLRSMLEKVIPLLKEWSDCEAVGIRIRDGEEYPFVAADGYSERFLDRDNTICALNEQGEVRRYEDGSPVYACTCGAVIRGQKPGVSEHFTPFGSFWSSDLENLAESLRGKVELIDKRNHCLAMEYTCSAIVPLKSTRGVIGLLQFQDRDASKITPEKVEFLENFSLHLALSVAQKLDATALKESETYYRHLVENATDSIFLTNEEGRVLDVNEAACESLGYPREELLGMSIGEVDPQHPEEGFKQFWASRQLDESVIFETLHLRKDGTFFPVEVNGKAFELHGERLIVGAARDITERQRHEEERNRLQQAIAQTGETIVVTDPQGTITYVNPAFEQITGFSAEEAIGRNPRLLKSGEHSREFYKELWNTISSGKTWKGRFVNRHKDGNHYVEDAVISPVLNAAGEIVNYISIKRDITEQQEAASKLTHSHDLMKYVIEHTHSAVAVHDRDLNYIYVSQQYLEEYNVKEQDVIGRHHYDVFPDLPQKWRDVHQRALRGEVSSADDDPYYKDDGTVEWTRWECRPWYEADGSIGGIIVYTEVTTEKRVAAEALKASEERFRTLADNIPGVVYLCENDDKYTMTYLNPEIKTISGYEAKEFTEERISYAELIHPEDRDYVFSQVDEAIASQAPFHLIYRLRHRDGHYSWVEEYGVGVFKEDKLQFLEGFIADVTHQKHEDDVLEAQMRLVEFANQANVHQLLQRFLDEAEQLTESSLGFYHSVDEQEENITLQAWSTNTISDLCSAEGAGIHYPVSEAGVWVDCIRERKPVIHNDYYSLPHRRGMPEGHAEVIRELVVPVFRNNRIVAVLGVGNKDVDYVQDDISIIQRLADLAWETVTRKQANENLQQSEERFRKVMASIRDLVFTLDKEQRHTAIYGTNIEDVGSNSSIFIGKTASEIFGEEEGTVHREACDRALKGEFVVYDWSTEFKGKTYFYQTSLSPLLDARGEVQGIVGVGRDITDVKLANEEQNKLFLQLSQAQKMESVGRLAGGIAHDFNNLLGVILGYAELGLEMVEKDHPSHNILQDIFRAAKKSSALTRQLLTFARKQTIDQRVLNLNEVIEGTLRMLIRLVGEEIDVSLNLAADLGSVRIDPTQVDQILANMAINSRDAIDGVGAISIKTENVTIDEVFASQHPESHVGDYVLLSISDDGSGMDDETMAQIFDPFFTTKRAEEGTGLGLSTVYGIVHQNNGFITCYSEPGMGTTFKLYLPRHEEEGQVAEVSSSSNEIAQKGNETVLLVEDEVSMLNLTSRILKKLGYNVLQASSPRQAIELAEIHAGTIDLLMTDVIMPEMNGKDLSEHLVQRSPGMKTLYMSGYTADIIARHGVLEEGIHFLPKPFSVKEIAAKVRAVFDK